MQGRSRSTADDVAYRILSDIRSGKYRPGDRLPTEPDLARLLGVGRTSVREGIGQLRMLGMVEVRRGIGTYICDKRQGEAELAFSEWSAANQYEIMDLFEVRMSLEATAAALAAQRASESQHLELVERARAHEEAHRAGDLDLLVSTDQAFHEALIASSQNHVLAHIYGELVPQLVEYRRKSLALEGASARSSHDHLVICEAVGNRQPVQAREAALAHLRSLYREVLYTVRTGQDKETIGVPVL